MATANDNVKENVLGNNLEISSNTRRSRNNRTPLPTPPQDNDFAEEIADKIIAHLNSTKNSRKIEPAKGLLSFIWGDSKSLPGNVAGLILASLTLAGIFLLFFPNSTFGAGDFWKISTPIITLALGYIFGKRGA